MFSIGPPRLLTIARERSIRLTVYGKRFETLTRTEFIRRNDADLTPLPIVFFKKILIACGLVILLTRFVIILYTRSGASRSLSACRVLRYYVGDLSIGPGKHA